MCDVKVLLKKLAANEDNFEHEECNYIDSDESHPLLEQLKVHSPELEMLIRQLTSKDKKLRADPRFRQKILIDLIPNLPFWHELKDEKKIENFGFLERRLTKFDLEIYKFDSKVIHIQKGFLAFYAGGLRVGGLMEHTSKRIIINETKSAHYLGDLSLVPTENEVLIPEGIGLKLIGHYKDKEILGKVSGEIEAFVGFELQYRRDCEYFLMEEI